MEYNFYIAALGASAGGLKAIIDFFANVRDSSGIAYVVALHSLREAKSHLPEIIGRVTRNEVIEITHGMEIRPQKIYIHPPSMKVSLSNGKFELTERKSDEKINKTIDHLYFSLAEEAREKAIAVIMSGTGSDGTEGFHVIEKYNGTTIVQNPETAQFDGMPLHSIKYDHPNYVLSPAEMPALIEELVRKNG